MKRRLFVHGLRIRWRRVISGMWRERCDICGKLMPLNGTGISETIGTLHPRYHAACYTRSMRELHGSQQEKAA